MLLFILFSFLVSLVYPSHASIQSGFPILARSGTTNGYVSFIGPLTGTGTPCLDGQGNLIATGCNSGLAAIERDDFTESGGQTDFSTTGSTSTLFVYLNGMLERPELDYTVSTIVGNPPNRQTASFPFGFLQDGDLVTLIAYR